MCACVHVCVRVCAFVFRSICVRVCVCDIRLTIVDSFAVYTCVFSIHVCIHVCVFSSICVRVCVCDTITNLLIVQLYINSKILEIL